MWSHKFACSCWWCAKLVLFQLLRSSPRWWSTCNSTQEQAEWTSLHIASIHQSLKEIRHWPPIFRSIDKIQGTRWQRQNSQVPDWSRWMSWPQFCRAEQKSTTNQPVMYRTEQMLSEKWCRTRTTRIWSHRGHPILCCPMVCILCPKQSCTCIQNWKSTRALGKTHFSITCLPPVSLLQTRARHRFFCMK